MAKFQIIDVENWKGKKHYEWFKTYPEHYYSITKQIDITKLIAYLDTHEINGAKPSFFTAFLYLITKSLNSVEEMRLRVEKNRVVLYDVIDPAYTVMTNSGVFENCENAYYDDFKDFYQVTHKAIEEAKKSVRLDKSYNELSHFNQYYFTCIPWIDFSSIVHPMPSDESSFVPRACWSKYTKISDKIIIALNIQVSHALVDGYPLAKAFLAVEENMNNPEQLNLTKK